MFLLKKKTGQLVKAAKHEKLYPEFETQLTALKNKVEASKSSDFTHFKSEISDVLEQQIAFHYALAEGQAQVSLGEDKEIQAARGVLNDLGKYKKILSPH